MAKEEFKKPEVKPAAAVVQTEDTTTINGQILQPGETANRSFDQNLIAKQPETVTGDAQAVAAKQGAIKVSKAGWARVSDKNLNMALVEYTEVPLVAHQPAPYLRVHFTSGNILDIPLADPQAAHDQLSV